MDTGDRGDWADDLECAAKVIVTSLLYNDTPIPLSDLEALIRPESYR